VMEYSQYCQRTYPGTHIFAHGCYAFPSKLYLRPPRGFVPACLVYESSSIERACVSACVSAGMKVTAEVKQASDEKRMFASLVGYAQMAGMLHFHSFSLMVCNSSPLQSKPGTSPNPVLPLLAG
jgi:hypothetical protein